MTLVAVDIDGLDVRYGRRFALRDVHLRVRGGTAVGLIGSNGSGKSTLLKAVAGLLPTARGTIRVFERAPRRNAAGTIAYVPQIEHVDWSFPATVRDVVAMGRFPRVRFYRPFAEGDREAVRRALVDLHIEDLADRHISGLSGGQQQRVFLARALAQDPQLFLLDEPTTGVDRETEDALRALVRRLVAQGRTVLMSTHDLSSIGAWFDEVAIVRGGIVAHGSPEEIGASSHAVACAHEHGHAQVFP